MRKDHKAVSTCLSNALPRAQLSSFNIGRFVNGYLNRADVRAKLGVDEWTGSQNFSMQGCSPEIMQTFTNAGDQLHSSNAYTEELLHRGLRVMHLVGAWVVRTLRLS